MNIPIFFIKISYFSYKIVIFHIQNLRTKHPHMHNRTLPLPIIIILIHLIIIVIITYIKKFYTKFKINSKIYFQLIFTPNYYY